MPVPDSGNLQRRSRPEAKGRNPRDVRQIEALEIDVVRYVEEGTGQASRCGIRTYDPLIGHVE